MKQCKRFHYNEKKLLCQEKNYDIVINIYYN